MGAQYGVVSTTGAPLALASCNDSIIYSNSGNIALSQVDVVTLPAQAGTLVFEYDSYSIPDRFVVQYGGYAVIDTQYVGDPSYTVSDVNAVLSSVGFDQTTQGSIISPGSGSMSFQKITTTADTAIIRVYAPLIGTGWDVKMTFTCPSPPGNSSPLVIQITPACEYVFLSDMTVQLVKNDAVQYTLSSSQLQNSLDCAANFDPSDIVNTNNCYDTYLPELVPFFDSCFSP